MRFFVALSAFVILFSGTTVLGSNDGCEPNGIEVKTTEKIVDLFNQHSEEKIVQRHFSHSEFQELIRNYTDDFTNSLAASVYYCEDKGYHTDSLPMSMIEDKIVEYLGVIKLLKQLEKSYKSNDVMQQQSLVLQEHMKEGILKKLLDEGFSEFTYTMNLGVMVDDHVQVGIDLRVEGEGYGNNKGTIHQSTFDIDLDAEMTEDDMEAEIMLDAGIEIRMIDGVLYIKVNSIDPNIVSKEITGGDLKEMEMAIAKMKLIEGKWIAMPLDGAINGGFITMEFDDILNANIDMISSAMGSSWLMQYHTEGDIMYGGLNPLACGALSKGMIQECLMSWMTQYHETNGKGFVIMHEYKGSYALGISDKFTNEPMPEETKFLNSKTVLWWDDNGIIRVELPTNDFGTARYENGEITIDFVMPVEDYDWETDSVVENNFAIRANGTLTTERVDMTMSMGNNDFSMSMSIDAVQKPIGSRVVTAPDENEIIPLEVLFE